MEQSAMNERCSIQVPEAMVVLLIQLTTRPANANGWSTDLYTKPVREGHR